MLRSPPESVADNVSSTHDGYSWSGAANEPLATPGKSWTGWVWQIDGQWCMIMDQLSAEGGKEPSSLSVALPENVMTSPTFQCNADDGELMVAVGALLFVVMTIDATSVRP